MIFEMYLFLRSCRIWNPQRIMNIKWILRSPRTEIPVHQNFGLIDGEIRAPRIYASVLSKANNCAIAFRSSSCSSITKVISCNWTGNVICQLFLVDTSYNPSQALNRKSLHCSTSALNNLPAIERQRIPPVFVSLKQSVFHSLPCFSL